MGGCSGSWCVKPAIWYPAMRAAPYFARNSLYSGGNLAPSSRSALVISSSDDGPETLSSLTILLLTCNTIGAASCYRARARNLGSIDLRATVLHQGWRQGNESAWLLPQSRARGKPIGAGTQGAKNVPEQVQQGARTEDAVTRSPQPADSVGGPE